MAATTLLPSGGGLDIVTQKRSIRAGGAFEDRIATAQNGQLSALKRSMYMPQDEPSVPFPGHRALHCSRTRFLEHSPATWALSLEPPSERLER